MLLKKRNLKVQLKQKMPSHNFNCYDMSNVKLRSDTSHMVGDRIYYIVKQFPNGKASTLYTAYDYKSGISVYWHLKKDEVIKWLDENADKIEKRFKKVGK